MWFVADLGQFGFLGDSVAREHRVLNFFVLLEIILNDFSSLPSCAAHLDEGYVTWHLFICGRNLIICVHLFHVHC